MADFDVQGSFGADVSKFDAGMRSAGSSAQTMANEVKAAADKVIGSFAGLKLDTFKAARDYSADLVDGMRRAGQAASTLKDELADTAQTAQGHGTGIGFYAREVHALADEMLSGRFGQFQGTMANVGFTFLQSHMSLIPYAAAVAAFGGTLAYIVVQAIGAKNALDQVKMAMALGGVSAPDEQVNKLIASLERLAGVSYDEAAKTVSAFSNMRNTSLPLIEALTAGVVEYATATEQKLPDAANQLRHVFEDPAAGAKALQQLIGGVTGEQIAYVEQTARAGSTTAAQSALLRIFGEAMGGVVARLKEQRAALMQTMEESSRFAAIQGESAGMTDMFSGRIAEQIRRIDERTEALRRGAEAVRSQSNSTIDVRAGASIDLNPVSQQLQTAEGKVRSLEAALKGLQADFAAATPGTEAYTRAFNNLAGGNAQLSSANAEVRRLNDQIGNTEPFERRLARINSIGLAEARDAVETAQERIKADESALIAFGKTADDRSRIEGMLAQHQAELRRAQANVTVAESALEVANAQKGSDAVLAAQLKGIAARRAAAGTDRAELLRLDTEEANARSQLEEANSQIARQAAQERMQIANNEVTQREQATREAGNQGRTSHAAELADLLALSQQREAIQREYLTTVRDTYEDDRVQYENYQRQLSGLASQYAARRAQIERQVGQQIYQSWNQSFQQVGSSVTSQIMGMIRGTTTFRQAATNVALDVAQQFIGSMVKIGASWLAGQAAMTAATIAGVGVRNAAETTGEAGSIAAALASAVARIQAGVAATIAGVSANQAMIVGPAAPAEGAAAGAAVAAQSYAALALDRGTWNVPQDMVAQIHRSEMVVPAFDAEAFRQQAGGGGASGGDTHFHFPGVMDTRGFLQAIANHSTPIARMIAKSMNQNPTLRTQF